MLSQQRQLQDWYSHAPPPTPCLDDESSRDEQHALTVTGGDSPDIADDKVLILLTSFGVLFFLIFAIGIYLLCTFYNWLTTN